MVMVLKVGCEKVLSFEILCVFWWVRENRDCVVDFSVE